MEGIKQFDQVSFQANDLIYRNFATKMQDHFIGLSIQKEYLYIVQNKVIYVYDYVVEASDTCLNVTPHLEEEIHLPFQITEFVITPKYICLKSKQKTQIRDRFNWEKLIFVSQSQKLQSKTDLSIKQQNQLFSEMDNDYYMTWNVDTVQKFGQQFKNFYSSKTDVTSKQNCKIMFGQFNAQKSKRINKQFPKPPIYLSQLGNMSNFYIWAKNQNEIELGMLFDATETRKSTFQISTINIPDQLCIKQLYHHRIKQDNSQMLSENLLVVCQNKKNQTGQTIQLLIYQILPPKKLIKSNKKKGQKNDLQALEDLLGQMQYLQNPYENSKQKQAQSKSALINQILQEVMQSQNKNNGQSVLRQKIKLAKGSKFIKSYYNSGWNRLWLHSEKNLAEIVFNQNLNVNQSKSQADGETKLNIIKRVEYFQMGSKIVSAIYQNIPIVIEKAYSFEMVFKRGQIFNQNKMNEGQQLQLNDEQLNSMNVKKVQNLMQSVEHQKIIDQAMRDFMNSDQFKKLINTALTKDQTLSIQTQTQTVSKNQCQNEIMLKQQQKIEQQKIQSTIMQKQTKQIQTQAQQVQPVSPTKCLQLNNVISYNLSSEIKPDSTLLKQQPPAQVQVQVSSSKQKKQDFFDKFQIKSLNFEKVQDALTRFSTLFVSSVTKQTNKLKQSNKLAKQQLKDKLKQIIKGSFNDVIQPLLSNIFIQKLEKQAHTSYDHTTRIFNQQFKNFNDKVVQTQIKQSQFKAKIIKSQMEKIKLIKEASLQVMNVGKVRQMQKIAYNQLILQSIKDVSDEVKGLQQKLNDSIRIQLQTQSKMVKQIQEIKSAIKQIVEQEEEFDDILSDDSESSHKGQESDDEEEQSSSSSSSSDSQERDQMQHFTQVNATNLSYQNRSQKATSLVNSQSPSHNFTPYYNHYQVPYNAQTQYNGLTQYTGPPPSLMNYNPVSQMQVPYNGNYYQQFGGYPPSVGMGSLGYSVPNNYIHHPVQQNNGMHYPQTNPIQISAVSMARQDSQGKTRLKQKKKKSMKH